MRIKPCLLLWLITIIQTNESTLEKWGYLPEKIDNHLIYPCNLLWYWFATNRDSLSSSFDNNKEDLEDQIRFTLNRKKDSFSTENLIRLSNFNNIQSFFESRLSSLWIYSPKNVAQNYLSKFSQKALDNLNQYERNSQLLMVFPIPSESNILKKKRQDLNILNSASETINSISLSKNKRYLINQLERIKVFFLFWKNWLFYCFL
jgi:hypothetical protein